MRTRFTLDRAVFAAAALTLALTCAACVRDGHAAGAASVTPARGAVITIHGYSFDPQVMEVAAGATVTWINRDGDVHTIKTQEGPQAFRSPALDGGGRFSFTFHRAGTYRYVCSIHPYMRGVIVVQ